MPETTQPEKAKPKDDFGFVLIGLDFCPTCGVGGEQFLLPIPYGGANHFCSQCGFRLSLRSMGVQPFTSLPVPKDGKR